MNIEEIGPGETGTDPYLIIGESKSEFMIISGHRDEDAAVTAYERWLKIISEAGRSRYEAVQVVQVLRHAEVSPEE